MTEQELREKIVKILEEAYEPIEYGDDDIHGAQIYFPSNEDVANALISAGIGDVKESKLESDHFWRMWQGALVELERAEHRAEVLGRALAIMKGKGLISCVVDDYISQAEKELQEENKDVR